MLCHAKSFLCSVTLYLLVWTPYLLASWSHGPDMDLVLHSVADSTPSFCLDGTPQAFYARRGHGSGEHKWLIFFEGGGWCYDMEQCYLRSKTESGSSRRHPPHRSSPHCLSGEAHLNPLLYNWNMIFVEYCDGSSFAGDAVRTYKVLSSTHSHFSGMSLADRPFAALLLPGYHAPIQGEAQQRSRDQHSHGLRPALSPLLAHWLQHHG